MAEISTFDKIRDQTKTVFDSLISNLFNNSVLALQCPKSMYIRKQRKSGRDDAGKSILCEEGSTQGQYNPTSPLFGQGKSAEILTLTLRSDLLINPIFNRSLVHSSARDQLRNYDQFGLISKKHYCGFGSLISKFSGFSRNFQIVFIPLTPVSEIFGTLFLGPYFQKKHYERGPLHRRGSPHRLGGGRAPGTSRPHHLPQEQEVVRPPRQQDVRCQDSGSSVQGQFLYITLYALDWLVCFRVF